ncbi:hypothetical protein FSU_0496 [Fibrobacter succinogenes subsp. succinogenes S85]|uniref:Uncharacterized protein n=1 Tax=Fibrobacter succinogenes (strain ATCC 19169 / S85) TaxID=59374 RepID=C9RJ66_FIBSS|nr:P-loop NTPase [Fibrobacter succinogenes]ACX73710.1 hypothetical protein Fisuc_0096 [Fibrobacter succinogenes subsp. succinogenes S85]ADL25906.1 hypothetical protein FSU_0496 [Fibrobacter succinogenes subsp. succinogenes S85]
MTFISKYAIALQAFLHSLINEERGEKFKVFIRAGFQIDVFVFLFNHQHHQDIEKKFDNFCKANKDLADLDPIAENDEIQIFFNIYPISELEDSFYSSIVNKPNCIDYGPRYRFDSFYSTSKIDLTKEDQTKIPVITFYSHKGGVGRTTAMASYALHLAKLEKNVAIIDCDLEAPGYLNFFNLSENDEHEELKEGKKNGLVEFLCDSQFLGKNIKIEDYILNVGARNRNSNYHPALDRIWLIPAGNLNEGVTEDNALESPNRQDYIEGLAKLNLGNTQNVIKSFNTLFEHLKTLNVDAILIDSRTGFNDIFGTATLHLSSCVVGFFGLSRQNEPGLINLLAKHVQNENLFKLILAYSILPKNYKEDNILMEAYNRMETFIMNVYDQKNAPTRIPIHRNDDLERIGIGDLAADKKFIDMNTSTDRNIQFSDYTQLFNEIDRNCFPEGLLSSIFGLMADNLKSNKDNRYNSYDLRNIILQHLKKVLDESINSAEEDRINENTFFYRQCMNDLFDKDKFIICGRKGTGKTHLCKSLQNQQISNKIKSNSRQKDNAEFIYANALPDNKDQEVALSIIIRSAFNKDVDYLNLWRIYTWSKLFLDNGNESLSEIRSVVKQQSPLANKYSSINGELDTLEFMELVNDIDSLLHIVEDLYRFDEELAKNNKKLLILYDKLDLYIRPSYWEKAISSLFEYWTHAGSNLHNIAPKIFIRTDLFWQSIQGSITELSPNNIISTEWTIEEIFGYLFKLIFSDQRASSAYWDIAKNFGIDPQYIADTEKAFKTNNNQLKVLSQAEMEPLLQVFFGKDTQGLGKPWDYFKKELSNADYTTNLQLFINILYHNAIDKSLAIAKSNITEIISPAIYTSTEVRAYAAKMLFEKLAEDQFCKNLANFQHAVFFADNGLYRYKSLDTNKFDNLINTVCEQNKFLDFGSTKENLINAIFSNGIMTINNTTKGDIFVFAPLYWYPWGLQEVSFESKNKTIKKNDEYFEYKDELASNNADAAKKAIIASNAALMALGLGSIFGGPVVASVASAAVIATSIAKMISKINSKK